MEKLKKIVLPFSFSLCAVLIAAIGIFASVVSGQLIYGDVSWGVPISCLVGLAAILAFVFVKEKHLHNAAPYIYAGMAVILVIQLLISDSALYSYDYSWMSIGVVNINTAALLPLSVWLLAKTVTKYKTFDDWRLFAYLIIFVLPILLVVCQLETYPAFVASVVMFIMLLVLKIKKRCASPWWMIIPIVAVSAGIFIYDLLDSSYMLDRLEVIFTRGACDPYGMGWVRTVLDDILVSSPFIGATASSIYESIGAEGLYDFGFSKPIIILAEYGWFAFIGIIVLYAVFIAVLIAMVKKTKQSSFAYYTSFFAVTWIIVKTVLFIADVFFIGSLNLPLPFACGTTTANFVDFILAGTVFSLYLKRNKPSEVACDADSEKSEDLIDAKTFKDYVFDFVKDDIKVFRSYVRLTDEKGRSTKFEFLDLVPYNDKVFVVFTEKGDNEPIILLYKNQENEQCLTSVDDEEELHTVFEIFREKNEYRFNFVDEE